MDQTFKENVIKSFGIVKGDVTAIQATLADISLALADTNKRHDKLVSEFHKLKITQVKMQQQMKDISKRLKTKAAKRR